MQFRRILTKMSVILSILASLMLSVSASAEPETAQVNAVIESVMLSKQSLKLTHDPVEAWGWPPMKMKFAVDPSIDLKSYSKGQRVTVTLKKHGNMAQVIAID